MKTSIIITSYNYENYIAETIESVIAQSVEDWELVIVDDSSTDNSVEIIKQYCQKDDRIKLYTHPDGKNHGLCASVKLGIEKATNDWVAFLESDDSITPNYLEEKLKMLEKYPDATFIYNNINVVLGENAKNHLVTYFENLEKIWEKEDYKDVFDQFGIENIVPTFSCVMCKKSTLQECKFSTTPGAILDYWLWWQIAENHKLCFVNKKLTNWRIHNNSYLRKTSLTIKHYKERAAFLPEILKLFKRKPKLSPIYFLEKNIVLSGCKYTFLYIKRKTKNYIKNLFVTR